MVEINSVKLTINKNLEFNYDVKFAPSTCYWLIGESGSGKTTFIDFLKNNFKKSKRFSLQKRNKYRGSYFVNGELINNYSKVDFVIMEQSNAFLEKLSIKSNLPKIVSQQMDILEKLNILEKFNDGTTMEKLSGGERRRLAFARMLLSINEKTKFIILDEPFNDLPDKDVSNMIALLEKITNKNVVVIFVSHNNNQSEVFLKEMAKNGFSIDKIKMEDRNLIKNGQK